MIPRRARIRGRRAIGLGLPLAVALLAGVAPGCNDDDGDRAKDERAARAKAQDADAQAAVRILSSQLEGCFVSAKDYTACDTAAERADAERTDADPAVPTPETDPATVRNATSTQYELLARSETGTTFSLEKKAGVLARTCSKPGVGGCADAGKW